MSKDKLFEILDGLEEGTRDIMINARKELEKRHGEDASQPWNIGYKMAGSVTKKMVRILMYFFLFEIMMDSERQSNLFLSVLTVLFQR